MIRNLTHPPQETSVEVIPHSQGSVICIHIEPSEVPVSTLGGKCLRRQLKPDGEPENAPFFPDQQFARSVGLGRRDYSAHVLSTATLDDLDPAEFYRLRNRIRAKGDQGIQGLQHSLDEDLGKALGLVQTSHGELRPTVTGMLLLGKDESLVRHLPTHEVRFHVFDERGDRKVLEQYRSPLLKLLAEIEDRFKARNEEREITIGLFRMPIPDYSPDGFREALNNAVLHRNYALQGYVIIEWRPDHIRISSPGGFLPGITPGNILVHEPVARNRVLANACQRIGLVEQTGGGVDKIYRGQLVYGRPIPDYTTSDSELVRVILPGGEPSLEFAALVYEQAKAGVALAPEEMLVLDALFRQRSISTDEAGVLIQRGAHFARQTLSKLVEKGMVEQRGRTRSREYTLSAIMYQKLGKSPEYIRTRGFDTQQREQMVVNHLKAYKRINCGQVMELCQITRNQALYLLRKLRSKWSEIALCGRGRGAYYEWRDDRKTV